MLTNLPRFPLAVMSSAMSPQISSERMPVSSPKSRALCSTLSLVANKTLTCLSVSFPEPKQQKSSQPMGQAIYERPEFSRDPVSTPLADDVFASALESVLADAFPEPLSQPQRSTTHANKDEFLAALTPIVKEVATDLGIGHKIVLSKAALEFG